MMFLDEIEFFLCMCHCFGGDHLGMMCHGLCSTTISVQHTACLSQVRTIVPREGNPI